MFSKSSNTRHGEKAAAFRAKYAERLLENEKTKKTDLLSKRKNKKMFEYSRIDKSVYFILFIWLSISMISGWRLSSKLEAPSFVKQIYSTYEKFMTAEDYNFFVLISFLLFLLLLFLLI